MSRLSDGPFLCVQLFSDEIRRRGGKGGEGKGTGKGTSDLDDVCLHGISYTDSLLVKVPIPEWSEHQVTGHKGVELSCRDERSRCSSIEETMDDDLETGVITTVSCK